MPAFISSLDSLKQPKTILINFLTPAENIELSGTKNLAGLVNEPV